jgi:hypothetical protein
VEARADPQQLHLQMGRDHKRKATTRADETSPACQQRLAKDRARKAKKNSEETAVESEQRLERDRVRLRMQRRRCQSEQPVLRRSARGK